jgi:hypothetical protein
MSNVLSGTVRQAGEGFTVLDAGIRTIVSSRVRPECPAQVDRVTTTAWWRGAEWVAGYIQVKN